MVVTQIYRFIQYFSRLIAWYLLRSGNKDTALRFDGLKSGLAGGRKSRPISHRPSCSRENPERIPHLFVCQ